jgi:hypothetical protein
MGSYPRLFAPGKDSVRLALAHGCGQTHHFPDSGSRRQACGRHRVCKARKVEMPPVHVRFQPTPNPNAGKFTVDRPVVEGKASRTYYSAADATGHPVASRLFQIDGVANLFMVDDFITVTKTASADWSDLVPRITAVIEQTME